MTLWDKTMTRITLGLLTGAALTVAAITFANASPRRMGADNVQVISHPAGCPARLFCGCGLAKYWGIWRPSLNLAANWAREFPRAHGPGVGVAAVRAHHVLGIVGGGPGAWQVVDFNSGGHRSHQYTATQFPGYRFVQVTGGGQWANTTTILAAY